jgi:hypothetical protein
MSSKRRRQMQNVLCVCVSDRAIHITETHSLTHSYHPASVLQTFNPCLRVPPLSINHCQRGTSPVQQPFEPCLPAQHDFHKTCVRGGNSFDPCRRPTCLMQPHVRSMDPTIHPRPSLPRNRRGRFVLRAKYEGFVVNVLLDR